MSKYPLITAKDSNGNPVEVTVVESAESTTDLALPVIPESLKNESRVVCSLLDFIQFGGEKIWISRKVLAGISIFLIVIVSLFWLSIFLE